MNVFQTHGLPPSSHRSEWAFGLSLLAIVAVAAGLRLDQLDGKVFAQADESVYAWSARYFLNTGHLLHYACRPMHTLLVAGLYLLTGPSALAGSVLMAWMGVGTVILVAVLGRQLGHSEGGLLASAAVAASPLLVFFSRLQTTQSDTIFFSLMSISLLVASFKAETSRAGWLLACSGISTGLTLTTNLHSFWFPIVMALVLMRMSPPSFESRTRRLCIFTGSALLVPLLIESWILWCKSVRDWASSESYFRMLLGEFTQPSRHGPGGHDFTYYAALLFEFEGWPASSLLLGGSIFSLVLRRKMGTISIKLFVLTGVLPLLGWSLLAGIGRERMPRLLAPALPGLYLGAGIAVSTLLSPLHPALKRGLTALVALAILTSGVVFTKDIRSIQARYQDVYRYLVNQQTRSVIYYSADEYLWPFYFFHGMTRRIRTADNPLAIWNSKDANFFIEDCTRIPCPSLSGSRVPERVILNPATQHPLIQMENNSWTAREQSRETAAQLGEIRLYRLKSTS